mgnify:CR=1 FL=1
MTGDWETKRLRDQETLGSPRIVISSEVEKSFSFAIRRTMFVNSKRETCYPQNLRASPHIILAALLYFYAPHYHS